MERHLCSTLFIINKPPSSVLISKLLMSDNDFHVRIHTAGYSNPRLNFVFWHITCFEFEGKTDVLWKLFKKEEYTAIRSSLFWPNRYQTTKKKNVPVDLWNQCVGAPAPEAGTITVVMLLKLPQSHFSWRVGKLFGARLGLVCLLLT